MTTPMEIKAPEVKIDATRKAEHVKVDLSSAEVLAIATIQKVVYPLDQYARKRVLDWARTKFVG